MQIHISLIPWLSRQTLQSSNWIQAACTAPNPNTELRKLLLALGKSLTRGDCTSKESVADAREELHKGWLYLRETDTREELHKGWQYLRGTDIREDLHKGWQYLRGTGTRKELHKGWLYLRGTDTGKELHKGWLYLRGVCSWH